MPRNVGCIWISCWGCNYWEEMTFWLAHAFAVLKPNKQLLLFSEKFMIVLVHSQLSGNWLSWYKWNYFYLLFLYHRQRRLQMVMSQELMTHRRAAERKDLSQGPSSKGEDTGTQTGQLTLQKGRQMERARVRVGSRLLARSLALSLARSLALSLLLALSPMRVRTHTVYFTYMLKAVPSSLEHPRMPWIPSVPIPCWNGRAWKHASLS